MKSAFLDKIVGRLDRLDPERLQAVLTRLGREKERLEAIFNALHEGVLVTDADDRVTYLNAAACDLLGFSVERALGQPLSRLLPELEIGGAPHRVTTGELEIFRPRHRLLEFYAMPLENAAALILRDVTASRKAAVQTIESQKLGALSLLAASVAHELGNPLNALSIHLQLLEREIKKLPAAKTKKARESLKVAHGEIERLDYIVTQFLQAIRPTQPKLKRESVNDLLADTLDFLAPEIANRSITIERDFSASLPRIFLDRAQIKQAFFNIVKNATQAMGKGGRLRITTQETADHVLITFADTGGGIAPDTLRKITKPYTTTKETGTGLGLLIVRRIVRDHGGDLELESSAGKGTIVRLKLPLAEKRMRLLEAGKQTIEIK